MEERGNVEMQEYKNTGVKEHRSKGMQEYRGRSTGEGTQEYGNIRIQKKPTE